MADVFRLAIGLLTMMATAIRIEATLWNSSYDVCCQGKVYDIPDQPYKGVSCCGQKLIVNRDGWQAKYMVCCNGQATEYPGGGSDAVCCGNKMINTRRHACCNNKFAIELDDRALKEGRKSCCGLKKKLAKSYDPQKQLCCAGVLHDKDGTKFCCGNDTYGENEQKCCQGNIFTAQPDMSCCGPEYISKTTHRCCNDSDGNLKIVPLEGLNYTQPECCIDKIFDKQSESCTVFGIFPSNTKVSVRCCGRNMVIDISTAVMTLETELKGDEMSMPDVYCDKIFSEGFYKDKSEFCWQGQMYPADGQHLFCAVSRNLYNNASQRCCWDGINNITEKDTQRGRSKCCNPKKNKILN